ncbi:hypothetical protein SAMN04488058_101470 [Deinococcus reticulitermitis]|uniref:Uncharacterized protein n=1 Tax=Deinococcus reticulitermitis TaxID=856736 RepID=A0A1H6T8I8_9DEIO|nr:hypothetical protein [Deinococcus reticulitermitis]SEI73437.1 hypothetical protein SAMN04488058_101470 [Deinococcus reticulitermitis]
MSGVNGVSGHPPAAEAYLRAATWPLPRAARQEARAELLAYLWQLRLDAEVRGLDPEAAWRSALEEAGPAWRCALGLARVHSLGTVRAALLVAVALGGAAYAVQRPDGPPALPVTGTEGRP